MKNKLFCRIYQLCSALLLRIKTIEKQELITGNGSVIRIADLLKSRGIARVELITTAGTVKRGMLDPLLARLAADDITAAVFDGVKPDPDIDCIEAAVLLFQEADCQAILAVGGGSALDCAKIAAARAARPDKRILQMKGLLKIHKKLPLLIAVPTTAGTGSEITAAAVVTDRSRNYKFTIMDFCIVPAAAVLDPALTAGLPAGITAETGMDAFTHAIEAYTNRFSSGKINDYAIRAMQLIDGSLREAVADGSNLKARESLLRGSYYAGIAFTNGYVGYVHALAHAVGGLYHIAHGRACAVILPAVLEAYGDAVSPSMAKAAEALGLGAAEDSDRQKRDALIAHIRALNRDIGIPETIEGLQEQDLPEIVRRADAEANPGYPVPVIFNREQLTEILRRLL